MSAEWCGMSAGWNWDECGMSVGHPPQAYLYLAALLRIKHTFKALDQFFNVTKPISYLKANSLRAFHYVSHPPIVAPGTRHSSESPYI
jgi:hypothetical protein